MGFKSGSIMNAIPVNHRMRFATAASIKLQKARIPAALKLRNFDGAFQKTIENEVKHRISLLGATKALLLGITFSGDRKENDQAIAEALYNYQQIVLEMPNRLSPEEFTPTLRQNMLPFTQGMLSKEDPRNHSEGKFLFASPKDFLEAFDSGLQMIKEDGMCGLIPVGGAGTRAAKELPKYGTYANEHGVTAETPRCLYPIPNTGSTFFGITANIIKAFGKHVGKVTPLFPMTTSATAGHFADFVRTSPEAAEWEEDVLFWNQRVVKRYDVANATIPLEEDYPAGHGDNAILGYQYGILQAMKSLGIKLVASSNSDEFLWYYLYPALISKMNKMEASMFAVAITNANNQMGGFFGNDQLVETPRIPFSYIRTGKAPEVLNSTFYGMKVDTLIKGAEAMQDAPRILNLVTKAVWIKSGEQKKLINMIGLDSWMGDEFSQMTLAGDGKFTVWESPRNLFLGMKGPQQVADHKPQTFLGGSSYSEFYTMMAHKVRSVLLILLGQDRQAKEKLAEQLFRNNFELMNVKL